MNKKVKKKTMIFIYNFTKIKYNHIIFISITVKYLLNFIFVKYFDLYYLKKIVAFIILYIIKLFNIISFVDK